MRWRKSHRAGNLIQIEWQLDRDYKERREKIYPTLACPALKRKIQPSLSQEGGTEGGVERWTPLWAGLCTHPQIRNTTSSTDWRLRLIRWVNIHPQKCVHFALLFKLMAAIDRVLCNFTFLTFIVLVKWNIFFVLCSTIEKEREKYGLPRFYLN